MHGHNVPSFLFIKKKPAPTRDDKIIVDGSLSWAHNSIPWRTSRNGEEQDETVPERLRELASLIF